MASLTSIIDRPTSASATSSCIITRRYFQNHIDSSQRDGSTHRPKIWILGLSLSRGDRGVVWVQSTFANSPSSTHIPETILVIPIVWRGATCTSRCRTFSVGSTCSSTAPREFLSSVMLHRSSFSCLRQSSSDLEWRDCYMTHFPKSKLMIRAQPSPA